MTALAMMAGMVPMALAYGEGSQAAPLGRAVIGGLLLGTVSGLSNLVVPRGSILVMYLLMVAVLLWRPRGLMGQKSVLEL